MQVCLHVGKDGGVDRIAACERLRLCDEWPLRACGGGDPDSEDAVGAIPTRIGRHRGAVLERVKVLD